MNKLSSFFVGILTGVVAYFGVYDVQALRIEGFPYQWFLSPVGYIVLSIVMVGLFFLAKILQGRLANFIISVVAYAILTFILFALFFPGYIFY